MNRWERWLDIFVGPIPWLVAVLMIAGVVHITSILAMPRLAPNDAFARMARLAPLHRMAPLPGASSGAASPPFEDPALAQGVCRYDLGQGPLRLRADLPADALTLLSFHARFGQIYYSMTDRSSTRGKLDVVIATPEQLETIEAGDNEDELPQELRILSPTRQGFVLVRALAESDGERPAAQARVLSVACALAPKTGS